MKIEWDPKKACSNLRKHRVSFNSGPRWRNRCVPGEQTIAHDGGQSAMAIADLNLPGASLGRSAGTRRRRSEAGVGVPPPLSRKDSPGEETP
jgi:hypothetical protein